jgi:DNA end-binding protein Ku
LHLCATDAGRDQSRGEHVERIEVSRPERPSNVINLVDALKQSLAAERGEKAPASAHGGGTAPKAAKAKKAAHSKAAKKVRKAG